VRPSAGPPGTGKSHLAIALGVQAVRAGKSVYMATLAEMVDSMRRAEREGRLSERVRFLARHSVLIVDEIGYLPVGSGGGNLFFQLVNACYERCAMIMTSNAASAEWAVIFGDAVVAAATAGPAAAPRGGDPIEGNSYRLREHANLLPEHLRNRAALQSATATSDQTRPRPSTKGGCRTSSPTEHLYRLQADLCNGRIHSQSAGVNQAVRAAGERWRQPPSWTAGPRLIAGGGALCSAARFAEMLGSSVRVAHASGTVARWDHHRVVQQPVQPVPRRTTASRRSRPTLRSRGCWS